MLKRLLQHFLSSASDGSANGQAYNGQTNGTASMPRGTTAAYASPSYAERDAYWKTQPQRSRQEQLAVWEQTTDALLAGWTADREEEAFLKRLLRKPDQRFDSVEVTANTLYRTFFGDQEGQGDVEFFVRRIVERNSMEQIQRNLALIDSLARLYGEQTARQIRPRLFALTRHQPHCNDQANHQHASAAHEEGARFSTLGRAIDTGEEIGLTASEREQALACFGAIGSGKSTLALNLILQDCRSGRGVVLIEPHGDLTRAVLAGLPESRLDDVVYLDLTDCATAPFGLNPFQCDDLQDAAAVAKTANFVHHTFMRTWDFGHHTPVLAMVLRHVTRLLIENPGSSFSDIPLLFHEDTAREKLVSNVTAAAPHTKAFWQQYNTLSPKERRELRASTENKIDAYLSEPLIANVLSQARTTIDFGTLLNERKIVLLNLSPQLDEISRLLGSLILGRILMSAYQRASVPEAERVPCYVYVDEWSRFCSDDLAVLIAESRKFKVIIGGLFNQTLETISDSNRATALQAGTLVTFRVSGDDSTVLARSYNCEPEKVPMGFEPQRAVAADPISHLFTRGHQDARVAAFSQRYLAALEHYLKTPSSPSVAYVKTWDASHDCFDGHLSLYDHQVQEGRKLLNECLYRCQTEANPSLYIPMIATYVLALSQRDGREYLFSPHVQAYNHGILFGPFSLKGFEESARKFGEAGFVEPKGAASYIASVAKYRKREKWMAEAVVSMLTELRYVMTVLSQSPIMVDTGQMVPKYQLRTYSDQQNQIANEISQLENYTARVKTLGAEHVIETNPPPPLLPEHEVEARIQAIKANNKAEGYTRDVAEVLEEIAKRQERLRQRPNDAPPPSHSTGRPVRRRRPPPQT
jgi:hypothetical protein